MHSPKIDLDMANCGSKKSQDCNVTGDRGWFDKRFGPPHPHWLNVNVNLNPRPSLILMGDRKQMVYRKHWWHCQVRHLAKLLQSCRDELPSLCRDEPPSSSRSRFLFWGERSVWYPECFHWIVQTTSFIPIVFLHSDLWVGKEFQSWSSRSYLIGVIKVEAFHHDI